MKKIGRHALATCHAVICAATSGTTCDNGCNRDRVRIISRLSFICQGKRYCRALSKTFAFLRCLSLPFYILCIRYDEKKCEKHILF